MSFVIVDNKLGLIKDVKICSTGLDSIKTASKIAMSSGLTSPDTGLQIWRVTDSESQRVWEFYGSAPLDFPMLVDIPKKETIKFLKEVSDMVVPVDRGEVDSALEWLNNFKDEDVFLLDILREEENLVLKITKELDFVKVRFPEINN